MTFATGSLSESLVPQFDFRVAPTQIPSKLHLLCTFVCFLDFFSSQRAHLTNCFPCLSPDFSLLQFLRVDQDKECNMECSGTPRKPLCASDGRTFTSRCEFLRAKCRDPQLEVIRGPCKGQVMSHASAPPPGARRHAEGVTEETCGLNSFQHN